MCKPSCQCRQCISNAAFQKSAAFENNYSLNETDEMELAMELLGVSSEAELDQFLGKMLKGAWRGIKKVASGPLGSALKALAKKALPFVGGALGSLIPIPGVGTAVGSALGGALSKALEMEYGELEEAEQELEMARSFVRIANDAAQQVANTRSDQHPQAIVHAALNSAIQRHLPHAQNAMAQTVKSHSGQWTRSNNTIVLTL
jgi:uncharacterized protein (DUF697 family)